MAEGDTLMVGKWRGLVRASEVQLLQLWFFLKSVAAAAANQLTIPSGELLAMVADRWPCHLGMKSIMVMVHRCPTCPRCIKKLLNCTICGVTWARNPALIFEAKISTTSEALALALMNLTTTTKLMKFPCLEGKTTNSQYFRVLWSQLCNSWWACSSNLQQHWIKSSC